MTAFALCRRAPHPPRTVPRGADKVCPATAAAAATGVPLCRGLAAALVAALALVPDRGATQEAAPAQAVAPTPFAPVTVPEDWGAGRLEGLSLRLPPGVSLMEDASDNKVWGLIDMASHTGVMFGVEFDDSPERKLTRDDAVQAGALLLPNGQILRRWTMEAPPEADVPGHAEVFVTDLPVRGDERLAISMMAMNTDFADHRAEFLAFLSGVELPAPGALLARDLLGGVLRLPLDGGWSGISSGGTEDAWLSADDLPGRLRLLRGAAEIAAMRTGTAGQAVRFMGQDAQLFGYEDGSETQDDGTGQTGQTRIVILETCLPDGAAISILFSGMPGFFHAPRVIQPFATGRIVLPEGAALCAPGVLPAGARTVAPGAARPDMLPPFDVAPPGPVLPRAEGKALQGLFSYRLPVRWAEAPGTTNQKIGFENDAGTRITLARDLAQIGGPHALAHGVPKGTWPEQTIYEGWPARQWQWTADGRTERLYLFEHCLPGDQPFGLRISAPEAFLTSGAFSDFNSGLELNMPDAIRPCPDPLLGGLVEAGAQPVDPMPAPTQTAPSQTGPSQTGPSQTGPSQTGPSQTGPGQTAPVQTAPVQTAPVAAAPAPEPQAPTAPPLAVAEPDQFFPRQGGYALYQNSRYGTFISYPSSYFLPDPPPDSNDGRAFTSVDGWARFYVFAQYNAESLTQAQQMARDIEAHGSASYNAKGPGWYVISGVIGTDIYYRRVIEDSAGLIRVFEISYPLARKAEFDAVVAYMAQSFGPGSGD